MGLKPDGQEFSQFLRLAFLRSPNYVAGASGWTINQDGSAEFNNVVIRNGQVVSGTALFYSSTPPAAGALVASVSSAAGTDHLGNAYLPGVVAYQPGTSAFAVQLWDAQITFNVAPSEAGPWTPLGVIQDGFWNEPTGGPGITLQTGGAGQLTIEDTQIVLAALVNVQALLEANAGLSVAGAVTVSGDVGITGDGAAVAVNVSGAGSHSSLVLNGASNAQVLKVLNTIVGGPSNPLVLFESSTSGDPILRVDVAGDTNARFSIDTNGFIKWGTGAASIDTHLYRAAAGQLAADFIAANVAGAAEIWNEIGAAGQPAFANSWSNAAGFASLAFRKVAAPYNSIQWVGRLAVPAGFTAGQAITGTIPSSYRPAHAQSVAAVDVNTGAFVRLQQNVGGALVYESGAGSLGDTIDITDGLVSLDA